MCVYVCVHFCLYVDVSAHERVCMEMRAFSVDWSSATPPKGNHSAADAVSYQAENIEQSENSSYHSYWTIALIAVSSRLSEGSVRVGWKQHNTRPWETIH